MKKEPKKVRGRKFKKKPIFTKESRKGIQEDGFVDLRLKVFFRDTYTGSVGVRMVLCEDTKRFYIPEHEHAKVAARVEDVLRNMVERRVRK